MSTYNRFRAPGLRPGHTLTEEMIDNANNYFGSQVPSYGENGIGGGAQTGAGVPTPVPGYGEYAGPSAAPTITPTGSTSVQIPNPLSYAANGSSPGQQQMSSQSPSSSEPTALPSQPTQPENGSNTPENGGEAPESSSNAPDGGSEPPPTSTIPGDTNGDGVLNYGEWIAEEEKRAASEHDAEIAGIDEQTKNNLAKIQKMREDSYKQAAIDRERGTVDANTAAAQNKATYGANAERMASMGLSGGGYTEYMDAQNYAAQRAEAQAWSANEAKVQREADLSYGMNALQIENDAADARLAADQRYNDRMSALGEGRVSYNEASFDELMKYASDGTYTAEQLAELAKQKGMSESQIAYITAAADKHAKEKRLSEFLAILQGAQNGSYDHATVDKLCSELGLTGADKSILRTAVDGYLSAQGSAKDAEHLATFAGCISDVRSGAMTASDIDQLAAGLNLTPDEATYLKQIAADVEKTTAEAEQKAQAASEAEILAGLGDDIGAIRASIRAGTLSQEAGEAKIASIQAENYNAFVAAMGTDSFNTDEIDNALRSEGISQDQYASIKTLWNEAIDVENFFDGILDIQEAQKALEAVTKHGWCSEATKVALTEKHGQKSFVVLFVDGQSSEASSNPYRADGSNFKVKMGDDVYEVQHRFLGADPYSGKLNPEDFEVGQIFGFTTPDGKNVILLRNNWGGFSVVEGRATDQTDYNKLYDRFF